MIVGITGRVTAATVFPRIKSGILTAFLDGKLKGIPRYFPKQIEVKNGFWVPHYATTDRK
jgi:hypothetical protein